MQRQKKCNSVIKMIKVLKTSIESKLLEKTYEFLKQ